MTKRYGEKVAVDDLSFTVRPGIVTGFLGPNGAGKSTTMRLIIGLDSPTGGNVTVNGKAYRNHPAPLHEVGTLLEARAIHTGRSAYNHLLALAQTHGIGARRVDEVIDLVGLREVARKRVGGFSLGMGQRLGIAAALLGDPETLIRRARERPRSRGHPLDPHAAAGSCRGGPDDLRLVPPDERDVADGRPADRRGTRTADREHDGRRLHPPGFERGGAGAHARSPAARGGACR
jgi:ABC-type transporter Mla maintaining outer membrane lipid asymmetry ATPase subunit MlaF